jgi:uncharacterized protein (DUF2252 family)
MARSAHAYVRGNTLKFYEWLESSTGKSVPQGPPVWICGDCHLGNLGPVADAKGRVKIAIRDLDQSVIGNPAHDLIRLGLSLATAIRGSDLPGVTTALMLEQMVLGYEAALNGKSHKFDGAPKSVRRVLKRAMRLQVAPFGRRKNRGRHTGYTARKMFLAVGRRRKKGNQRDI